MQGFRSAAPHSLGVRKKYISQHPTQQLTQCTPKQELELESRIHPRFGRMECTVVVGILTLVARSVLTSIRIRILLGVFALADPRIVDARLSCVV